MFPIWLVVWNIFYFPMYWECHHPNWRTHIFQRGRSTTNQLYNSRFHIILYHLDQLWKSLSLFPSYLGTLVLLGLALCQVLQNQRLRGMLFGVCRSAESQPFHELSGVENLRKMLVYGICVGGLHSKISLRSLTGWCFGTWIFVFHILGTVSPTDELICLRGRSTTNQLKIF